jgi:hypothetical protein
MALVNVDVAGWAAAPELALPSPLPGPKEHPGAATAVKEGPGVALKRVLPSSGKSPATQLAHTQRSNQKTPKDEEANWVCMDDETPIWLTDAQAMALVSPAAVAVARGGGDGGGGGGAPPPPVMLPKPLRAATPYIIFFSR